MPSGRVARRLAFFIERVDERQEAAFPIGLHLKPQGLLAPPQLQYGWRIVRHHFPIAGWRLTVAEHEAQCRTGRSFALDIGRKPDRQVLGFGERPPDLLRWVRQPPRE